MDGKLFGHTVSSDTWIGEALGNIPIQRVDPEFPEMGFSPWEINLTLLETVGKTLLWGLILRLLLSPEDAPTYWGQSEQYEVY